VLEVGTGSSYQAAVLTRLAKEVYSIECIEGLQDRARVILIAMGVTGAIESEVR
jgi:protein-L-isoaspartate(D-aspartate) O-methyltransferase